MEHVIAVIFALGFPAVTAPTYARRRAAILAGDSALKRREYLETILWLSSMGIASVAFFVASGRELSGLGLTWSPSTGGIVALSLAIGLSALLWMQARAVRRDAATREATRHALEPVREYFPATPGERHLFRGVSFAAGIGEELFYRGFLIWYLGEWLPVWGAVVGSSVLFGLAHVMHGTQATLRSTVTGFVLAGLYLLGGSLIAPMILHTSIDLSSGASGFWAFREEGLGGESDRASGESEANSS